MKKVTGEEKKKEGGEQEKNTGKGGKEAVRPALFLCLMAVRMMVSLRTKSVFTCRINPCWQKLLILYSQTHDMSRHFSFRGSGESELTFRHNYLWLHVHQQASFKSTKPTLSA